MKAVKLKKARIRVKRNRPDPGSSPGLFRIGEQSPATEIRAVTYSPAFCSETEITVQNPVDRLVAGLSAETGSRVWIDICGFRDEPLVRSVLSAFSIHLLAVSDLFNSPQRPKCDDYGSFLLIIAHTVSEKPDSQSRPEMTQVGILVTGQAVITIRETAREVFDPVLVRLQSGKGLIRSAGPGYLAYAILDSLVDRYFPLTDQYMDLLLALETEAIARSTHQQLQSVHALKAELIELRRFILPLKDVVSTLIRNDHRWFPPEIKLYLRDTHDHMLEISDLMEMLRDLSVSVMDLTTSSISNKMNDRMKVLTIITTVFTPLTFLAGLYGMNFSPMAQPSPDNPMNMPELFLPWGYPAVLSVMLLLAAGMLSVFWWRGWFDRGR